MRHLVQAIFRVLHAGMASDHVIEIEFREVKKRARHSSG